MRELGIAARVGRDDLLAVDDVLHVPDDRGDLGDNTFGLAKVGFGGVVLAVGVAVARDREHRADDIHRHRRALLEEWAAELERLDSLGGECPVGDQFVLEEPAFLGRRLVVVKQEVGDILEGCIGGKVVDLVAAVDERALLDRADRGITGHNAFESCRFCSCHNVCLPLHLCP